MDPTKIGRFKIRPSWVVAAGLAVLALVAAGIPLGSLLSLGVLLLCPLLMWSMHGSGHGQGHGSSNAHVDGHAHDPSDAASTWRRQEPQAKRELDGGEHR